MFTNFKHIIDTTIWVTTQRDVMCFERNEQHNDKRMTFSVEGVSQG